MTFAGKTDANKKHYVKQKMHHVFSHMQNKDLNVYVICVCEMGVLENVKKQIYVTSLTKVRADTSKI